MSSANSADRVTPSRTRSRWVPVVLGVIAVVLLVLGFLGFPLIPLPSRTGNQQQFASFGTDFSLWRRHAGWRYTSDSWVYWAGVTACAMGFVTWWLRVRGFTRRYALVAVPTAAVLALGPIVQNLSGLKSSDYEPRVTFGGNLLVSALAVAGMLVLIYFAELLRRYVRSSSRGRRSLRER